MTQVTQVDTGVEGNTDSSTRARAWCMTLNNYSNEEFVFLTQHFEKKCTKYIVGKEVGDMKTPHLQIYVRFKSAIRFGTLKKLNDRMHIEKAKGSDEQNWTYCAKGGDYTSNYDCMTPRERALKLCQGEYKDVKWHKWQQEVLDILNTKPDNRSIYWYYDRIGNVGKSFLCKYICMNYKIIMCDGKKNDILNQVNVALESYIPEIVIMDIPRSGMEYVNYGVIEQLKNGCLYSGKYEGGKCIFPHPHVIIFGNNKPVENEMSSDRWIIRNVTPPAVGASHHISPTPRTPSSV